MLIPLKDITVQLWMVIILVGLGSILDLVSFSLPQWNEHATETWGLWRRCTELDCFNIDESSLLLSSAMRVGRASVVLGFLCYVATVTLMVLYLTWRQSLYFISAKILSSFGSLVFLLLGAILWSSSCNTTLSWGYYLCYLSGLAAAAIGGVLLYVRRQLLMQEIEKQETPDVEKQ